MPIGKHENWIVIISIKVVKELKARLTALVENYEKEHNRNFRTENYNK